MVHNNHVALSKHREIHPQHSLVCQILGDRYELLRELASNAGQQIYLALDRRRYEQVVLNLFLLGRGMSKEEINLREALQLETYLFGIRLSRKVLPRRSLQTIEFYPGYRIDTPRSATDDNDDDIVPARLILAGGNQQLVLTQRSLSPSTDLEELAYFLGQYLGKKLNRFPERSQGSSRPHH
ncbi:hypothetical protein D3A95_00785 [Thermosynechococcus sichuanensis E542]|nr:hypothetical protein D3A95_00785 [Thermosynechococcus vestitus E542]